MSKKVLIDEQELRKLLDAYYNYQVLDCGGVDNWEAIGWAYEEDLKYWNESNPNCQFENWNDLMEYMIDCDIVSLRQQTIGGVEEENGNE